MSGSSVAFSKIDTVELDTVLFGNDSVAHIKIRGIFECKNSELQSLLGVYFILRLTMNIIISIR